MCVARLLLLAALPTLSGVWWVAEGEVVSVLPRGPQGGGRGPQGGGRGPQTGSRGPQAGARGPAFVGTQRRASVTAVGQDVELDCRVARLGDKTVSWVRSRDLQILTHAGDVFTADARVSTSEAGRAAAGWAADEASRVAAGWAADEASRAAAGWAAEEAVDIVDVADVTRHTLRIERLRVTDSGRYECQVNTEPKMSLFFNLTVVAEPWPRVVVSAQTAAARGAAGGAATLACEARYEPAPRALPLPPLELRWRRRGDPRDLSLQSSRGGISLDTERWEARVVSRLTLAGLRPGPGPPWDAGPQGDAGPPWDAGTEARGDAGEYECAVGDVVDYVALIIDSDEQRVEAMQRDQSASGAARAACAAQAAPARGRWLCAALHAAAALLLRHCAAAP